jgi:DNA-directed RNA polymerase specialized sigma24 family protein
MQSLHQLIFSHTDMPLQAEKKLQLSAAILQLPAENRTVIQLHFQEKLSRKEVALCLGWSLSKVHRKLSWGIGLLRRQLDPTAFDQARLAFRHKMEGFGVNHAANAN